MTGDVEKDFGSKAGVITVVDPGELDVGLPPGFAAMGLTVSGWCAHKRVFSRTREQFFQQFVLRLCFQGHEGHSLLVQLPHGHAVRRHQLLRHLR